MLVNGMHLTRSIVSCLILVGCIGLSGCVRRRMTVRTNPPGAMVYVDRQPIGQTPVSDNFTYYGTRHFEIVKDGYRTETFLRTFNPPWYEFPPLDFITENLWPFEKRDERIVDVQMVPEPTVPQEAIIASAEGLRLQASQGIAVVPTVPANPNMIGYPNPALNQRYVDPTLPGNGPNGMQPGAIAPGVTPMRPNPNGTVIPAPSTNLGLAPPNENGFLPNLLQPPLSDPILNITPGNSYRPANPQ